MWESHKDRTTSLGTMGQTVCALLLWELTCSSHVPKIRVDILAEQKNVYLPIDVHFVYLEYSQTLSTLIIGLGSRATPEATLHQPANQHHP